MGEERRIIVVDRGWLSKRPLHLSKPRKLETSFVFVPDPESDY